MHYLLYDAFILRSATNSHSDCRGLHPTDVEKQMAKIKSYTCIHNTQKMS